MNKEETESKPKVKVTTEFDDILEGLDEADIAELAGQP